MAVIVLVSEFDYYCDFDDARGRMDRLCVDVCDVLVAQLINYFHYYMDCFLCYVDFWNVPCGDNNPLPLCPFCGGDDGDGDRDFRWKK
jgi:hypothetical protein